MAEALRATECDSTIAVCHIEELETRSDLPACVSFGNAANQGNLNKKTLHEIVYCFIK